MDKLKFMIASFISLFVFTTFVSAYPQEVGDFTGLETSNIDGLDFQNIGINNDQFDSGIRNCPAITVQNYDNIVESESFLSKEVNETVGWIEYNVDGTEVFLIDLSHPGFFDSFSEWATISLDGGEPATLTPNNFPIQNDPYAINTTGFSSANISLYNENAVLRNVTSQCINLADQDESGPSGILGVVYQFSDYLVAFLDILTGIVSTFFQLLQVSGNPISVAVLNLWIGSNILGWLFIIADIVRGNS